MNFNSILTNIFTKIKKERDVLSKSQLFNSLQENINNNHIYKHQFEMINMVKEAKDKIKNDVQLNTFLKKVRTKNFNFIKENKINNVEIWNENKKLMEYYNINPNTIIPSLIDKSIDINAHKKLNEEAIKSYIGKVEIQKTDRRAVIKESFSSIGNLYKEYNTNLKIVRFLSESLKDENKIFISKSLTKLREDKRDIKSNVKKLYKLRLVTENALIKEFQNEKNNGDIQKGSIVKLPELSVIKKIRMETPSAYKKNIRKVVISFEVPFYPVGARFSELKNSALEIKNKLESMGDFFIKKCLIPQDKKLFDYDGSVWHVVMRETAITPGQPNPGKVKLYINGIEGKWFPWEEYYKAAYAALKQFEGTIEEQFSDELSKDAQDRALAEKDPNRQRAVKVPRKGNQKRKASSPARKPKKVSTGNDEMFDFEGDDFGGLF